MATGKSTALCLFALGACVFLTNNSRAEEPLIAADGCAILGGLVYAEVLRSGWYGHRGVEIKPHADGQIDIKICSQTAQTVSAAFGSALTQLNIHVSWPAYPGSSGDSCLSHYLSECYPERYPLLGETSAWNPAFVNDAWSAVQRSVLSSMPLGSASDISRFDRPELRSALRRSFSSETAGTWSHYYQRDVIENIE